MRIGQRIGGYHTRHLTPEMREAITLASAESARAAVREMFLEMGVTLRTPDQVEALRKDFDHLRTWREFYEFAGKQGTGAAIKWLVTGLLTALALGVYVMFAR